MNNFKYEYIVNNAGRRVTVAYQFEDSADGFDGIKYATAECSKRDAFVKKIGRDVASGRLNTHGGTFVDAKTLGSNRYADIRKYLETVVK